MILNNQIWKATVAAALAVVTGNAAWVRAIERGAKEIERAAYWSFADGVLTIKSTTSGKLYRIDDQHACEATANSHKACKHRAAHRLLTRYAERLGVATAEGETKRVQNCSSKRGHEVVETQSMLIEASKAVLVKRAIEGETYGRIAV